MRLLLVEDNILIRRQLEEIIKGESNSIDICHANDGRTAIKKMKNFVPDILFTDIVMPEENGISVAKHATLINPDCQIVFLSAYPEKEYFLSAIKLRAVDFIEKPFSKDNIIKVLKKVVQNVKALQSKSMQERIYCDKSFIEYVLNNNGKMNINEYTVAQKLSEFYMMEKNRTNYYFNVVVLKVFKHVNEFNLLETLNECFSDSHTICMWMKKHEKIFLGVLIDSNENATISEHKDGIEAKINALRNVYPGDVASFFVGTTIENISDIYKSYEAAVVNMERNFLSKKGLSFFDDELPETRTVCTTDIKVATIGLNEILAYKNKDGCMEYIDKLVENLKNNDMITSSVVKKHFLRIFFTIESQMISDNIFFDDIKYNPVSIMNSDCGDDIITIIKEMIDLYFYEINRKKIPLVTEIVRIINSKFYDSQLSLATISDEIGYSVSYMCPAFKSEMGCTINQYITNVRLNRAKTYLMDEKTSISDIAEKIGLVDDNYFVRLFKKHVGCTPNEYRNRGIVST